MVAAPREMASGYGGTPDIRFSQKWSRRPLARTRPQVRYELLSRIFLAHNGDMLSVPIARQLRAAGLRWRPSSGDSFVITREGFEGDVFVVSDMTIESHEFETGTILGFNGTTEWALDSVAIEDALWLPREDQLRQLLGSAFDSLIPSSTGYAVGLMLNGELSKWEAVEPADAYAAALLRLVLAAV